MAYAAEDFIINPSASDKEVSHLDLIVAGTKEAINMVEHQLFIMNDLSRSKNSVVDSTTLTVTIYQSSARARGVNKYIVHWNGLTERWMDSDNTKAYIRGLETGGNVSKFVPGWVGSMAKLINCTG